MMKEMIENKIITNSINRTLRLCEHRVRARAWQSSWSSKILLFAGSHYLRNLAAPSRLLRARTLAKTNLLAFFLSAFIPTISFSQAKTVSKDTMQMVYEKAKTPFKYGLVIAPESNDEKIDCPTIFRKGNSWYMTYLIFTGRGYQTWLAKSSDLLNWKKMGKLMSFSDTTDTKKTAWDANQKAGYPALENPTWGGNYGWEKYNNKYWMSYFGGKVSGYEAGLLSLGMAYTDKPVEQPHEWQRLPEPILTSLDKDVRWWENKKQFKSTVIWDKQKLTGFPFVMYYNANGDSAKNNIQTRWFERIGMAVSNDMVHWQRYLQAPVMHHPRGITGDAVLEKMGNLWVMFYFGAFWEGRTKEAFNRFACSYDLVHWTDWDGADLINSSEPYDARFAHKSFLINYKGVTYHFYCGVDKKDHRGIAVATSKDLGKSKVEFVAK